MGMSMARLRVPAVVGLALLGFSGCTDLAAPSGGGFQQQYFAARDALETGRYDAAARSYQKLLKNYPAGAVEARLMLELIAAEKPAPAASAAPSEGAGTEAPTGATASEDAGQIPAPAGEAATGQPNVEAPAGGPSTETN